MRNCYQACCVAQEKDAHLESIQELRSQVDSLRTSTASLEQRLDAVVQSKAAVAQELLDQHQQHQQQLEQAVQTEAQLADSQAAVHGLQSQVKEGRAGLDHMGQEASRLQQVGFQMHCCTCPGSFQPSCQACAKPARGCCWRTPRG